MKTVRILGKILALVGFLFSATPIFAAGPPVVINEVMYDTPDEWVELYVNSTPGDMAGWTLQDTAGNIYTFPSISPNVGEYIILHTGSGTDDMTGPVYELYWGRGAGVWNNTGDEILLTDGTTGVDYIAYEGASQTINGSLTWTGPNPSAAPGNAIALNDLGVDTDSGAGWHEVLPPTPSSVAAAANWLLSQQDITGGFPWTSGGSVTNNTQGPTAQAELMAYTHLSNVAYLNSAVATGDYLVPTYPRTYTDGDPRFASHDPLFLEKLSIVSNTTTYADFLQTNFWDKLTAGVYGETNDQNAGAYATAGVDGRQAQGLVALSPWDLSATSIAAHIAGETTIRDAFIYSGVLEGLNRTTAGDTFEVIGLAGAVWASAETGVDLDPTTGAYAADNTTADLAARLAGVQLSTLDAHSGGWAAQFPGVPTQFTRTVTGTWQVGFGNAFDTTLTKQFANVTNSQISFAMRRNIEQDWDYGQVLISSDGVNFTPLAGTYTTTSDPYGQNPGNGITGYETGDVVVTETMTIPGFVSGNTYWVRFRFIADGAASGNGGSSLPFNWEIDNITVNGITDDASSDNGWVVEARAVQNADTQVTAYAVMALQAFDATLYHNQIAQGVAYLRRVQATTGQILTSPGASPTTGGGVEVHAEAQRALIAAAPGAVCVDDGFTGSSFGDTLDGSGCGMGSVVFGYDAFATITDGIDAVATAGTVNVADGRYPETLNFTKNVTIAGQSEAGVVIDTHTFNSYGLHAYGDAVDVTLRNFTLIGPMPTASGYGIKIAGDNARATIENVTVTDSGRSGIDLNGLAAVTITDVTAQNNGGVGLALTDSSNATVSGLTTAGNGWGGAAVYVYGNYYTLGSDGVVFTGTNTFGEMLALTLEATPTPAGATLANITNLTLPAELSHSVQGLGFESLRIDYTINLTNALTAGVGGAPLAYARELATGDFYVGAGMSIQTAETAAADGDTIRVLDGTFTEQVMVDKSVSLVGNGAANTIIQSPPTLSPCFTTSYTAYPIVCITNTAGAQLDGFTIDGAGLGNANYKFMGVAFRNAGGTVQNSAIQRIEDTPFSGAQHGVALYAYNDDGVTRAITVTNNIFTDFQKNAMALAAGATTELTLSVTGNQISGKGATPTTAQNGIQTYGDLITGVISGNTVSGIAYDGASWVASSILNIFSNLSIENNVVTQAQVGVYNWDGSADIASNTIGVVKAGDYSYGIVATDPPDALPSPFEAVLSPGGTLAPRAKTLAATVALTPAITVTIRSNTISASGVDTYTFGIEADAGYGVNYLNLTVDGNAITGFDEGLVLYQTTIYGQPGFASVTVSNNTLTNNGVGIDSYYNTGTTILSGNTLTGNTDGLFITGATALTLTGNIVYANTNNGMTIADDLSAAGVTAVNNQFCDNGTAGIENQFITTTLTATGNWWGAVDGPGPVATGNGDGVSAGVDYSNFIITPPTTGPCQVANLTIAKATDPATGETGFTFGGDLGAFSLDDGGSQLFQLTPGTYTITETAKSGWELTGTVCTVDSTPLTNGVSVPLARGDDVTCTFTNDPLPNITLSKTAAALTMPESGGVMTFTVRITNTTAETVALTTLTDDVFGDLNGRGTCATGGDVPANGSTSCVFTETITGNAGDIHTDTITATVTDGEANTAAAADGITISFTDVKPAIRLTQTPAPAVLPEPGGVVTFTVQVDNLGVEPVLLVTLYDDTLYRGQGNLNGLGDCAVGGTIPAGDGYTCTFTKTVSGTAGDTFRNSVLTSVVDDENNVVSASDTATVTLSNVNDAPTFTGTPVTTATEDVPFSDTITASDVDAGDVLTITAPILPAWLTLTDNGDGTADLSGTPANADVGTHPVSLLVTDTGGLTDTRQFTITVANVNDAPVFTSTPPSTATIGSAYTYTITVEDVDAGDVLTITAPLLPAWLTFTDNGDGTATLTGTPATDDAGDNPVTLQVSDGTTTVSQQFGILVSEPAGAGQNILIFLPLVMK